MKLIWKNKIFWKENEYCPITGHKVDKWYIHPLIAIPTIVMALPASYFLCEWIFF